MVEDKVVRFNGITKLDIPSKTLLQYAIRDKVEDVIIIGYDADGEIYFSSSKADGGYALWLLEMAKKELLGV